MKNLGKVLTVLMMLEGACLALKPKAYLQFWRLDGLEGFPRYKSWVDRLAAMDERIWRVWGIGEIAAGIWLCAKKSR